MKQYIFVNLKAKRQCNIALLAIGILITSGILRAENEPAKPLQTSDPGVAELVRELHDKGWIIYSARSGNGSWDLFLTRPDGSGCRNITSTPGFNEAGAKFSPDGQNILYYRMPKEVVVDNNKYGTYELIIANSDGTKPVVWGNDYPWASWGPDGKRLACLTIKGIRIVDLATKKLIQTIPRKGIVQQLSWSPDGQWFAGTANGLGPYWTIGCMNATTGELGAVSEVDRYNCTPDWFPDSKHVIYARGIIPDVGGYAQLWSAEVKQKETRLLYAEQGRHIYGGATSPDGRYLLFTRSEQDLGEVDNSRTTMAIMRFRDAPFIVGKDRDLRKSYPNAKDGPALYLSWGWEPHWTYAEIGGKNDG